MPIKFRCSYCRQFLGISRGRAGDVVDCPTCGRSIRVPGLDGAVAPLPSPEIDRRDAKLTRALDELARWDEPQPAPVGVAAADEADAEAEEEIPQPIAEPIPIEVPVAPEPIAIKPPPHSEPRSAESSAAPATAAAEPAMSVAAAIDELAQISAVESPRRFHEADSHEKRPRRRTSASWKLAAFGVLLAGCAFAAGLLVNRSRPSTPPPEDTATPPEPAAAAAIVEPAIAGRITYKTADGESLPDRGARVLVLPREREGTVKLSAVGFRAADNPTDIRVATASIQALGGDFALTDDGGQFTINLPNPGTFHIIVVSNYAERDPNQELDPELVRQLKSYFEQPAQVLGRTKVTSARFATKGPARKCGIIPFDSSRQFRGGFQSTLYRFTSAMRSRMAVISIRDRGDGPDSDG